MAAIGCAAALTPVAVGLGAVGAVVGFGAGAADITTTFTQSTKHVTTTNRMDLSDAPVPECEFPGLAASLVSETSTDVDPLVLTTYALGPTTIYIGEDQQTPFELCVVVAAVRFTGSVMVVSTPPSIVMKAIA